MNEHYRLNSGLVQAWLDKEDRKQSFLVKKLGVSGSLVAHMLAGERVPKEKTLNALAELMGVKVSDLLIDKGQRKTG